MPIHPHALPWLTTFTPAHAVVVAGVLARMAVAVWAGGMPLAAGAGFRVQAAVALVLAVAATPAALAASPTPSLSGSSVLGLLFGEALVGLGIGLAAAAVFASASWAGQLLGSVTGLSWADDFGEGSGAESAGVGRLAWWLGLAGFVAAGGHEAIVAGLVDGVRSLPVGAIATAAARDNLLELVAAMPSIGLSLAISLALPALAAVLACHLVAAIAVRSVGFDPGQGLLQAVASLVLLAAVCGGTDSWIGGFAAAVQSPLERCFHDLRP
jgi:flagellar biosynthesis protein FliR